MNSRWIISITMFYISVLPAFLLFESNDSILSAYCVLGLLGFYLRFRKKTSTIAIGIIIFILSFFLPWVIPGFPIIIFGLSGSLPAPWMLVSLVPIIFHRSLKLFLLIFTSMILAYILRQIFFQVIDKETKYRLMFDSFTQKTMNMEIENRTILENKEYELQNAVLSERNRIARDIHDNLGHLLTRCILQLGALTLSLKDEHLKSNLNSISNTMNLAMNEVRYSIHNIHSSSINIDSEIKSLIQNFNFCPVVYSNSIDSILTENLAVAIIFIVKESLTNIAKHSDATEVNLRFFQISDTFHFVIADNGTMNKSWEYSEGLGLKSMKKRIEDLGGSIHINNEKGFRIFIKISKENK